MGQAWVGEPEQVYRPERLVLVHRLAAAAVGVFGLVGQIITDPDAGGLVARALSALAIAVIAGVILSANRRRVEVWSEGLRVVNWLTSRSYRWEDIRFVDGDRAGIVIYPVEGERYIGTIVGVDNWRRWLERCPAPAGEIADLATERASRSRRG